MNFGGPHEVGSKGQHSQHRIRGQVIICSPGSTSSPRKVPCRGFLLSYSMVCSCRSGVRLKGSVQIRGPRIDVPRSSKVYYGAQLGYDVRCAQLQLRSFWIFVFWSRFLEARGGSKGNLQGHHSLFFCPCLETHLWCWGRITWALVLLMRI